MENAFKNILGHAGNVVDAVALGGTARNIRNANAFDNYMQGGQYDQALELAVKNGAGNHAALAQQQIAKQQAQADEFDQNLVNLAAHLDSVPDQNQRMSTIQTMMPFYVQQGLIDEQDVPFIMQAAQTQGGLSALVGMNTAPQDQFDNRLAVREADQTDYSNQTNRMNAGTAQQRLGLDREKFGEDVRQFDEQQELSEQEFAMKQAAAQQKAQGDRPDRQAADRTMAARAQRVSLIADKIDEAVEQSNWRNTGNFLGSGFNRGVPLGGQSAQNLSSTIETIKANIGFEELQRMRDSSPTGGALGQVTEKEIAFLQSVLGSLEQTQSTDQFDNNLLTAKAQIQQSFDRMAQAYEQDYGQPWTGQRPGAQNGSQAMPPQTAPPPPPAGFTVD
jgi:hypothetical protein